VVTSRPPDIVLRGPPGIGPLTEGEALVSQHGFSARYDLNRKTGVFSRETHDLNGQSVVGKILVHTTAKGGVATAWALLDMRERGTAPLGLIFQATNPIIVQGAALAGLPILHRLELDPLSVIESGDDVRLDPARGVVEVEQRASGAGQGARGPDARAHEARARG
jgi:predicted aconitase with swiveling domain